MFINLVGYFKNWLILGILLCNSEKKNFSSRSPRKRPFFHPATLYPKQARIMVNLSIFKYGDVLLDPFCGVGGILIEGGLIGAEIVGCEIFSNIIKGAVKNLKWAKIRPLGMIRADSTFLPLRYVDVIVTDPPYGTTASVAK